MKNNTIHPFYKALHQIFNTILIVGFIFQALIFSIEINDHEITLPRFVLSKIENFLSENNLSYEADSIKLKLTGEVNCEKLRLKYGQFLEPILTCDNLSLNLSFFSLIFGRFNPEEIVIKNATLFCPPSLTPTGLNEPLIKNFFGAISLGRKYIQLQQLDFDFQNISIIADGAWSKKSSNIHPFHSKIHKPLDALILDYLSFAQTLINMKDKFSIFHKPVLTLHIAETENNRILLDIQMNASKCEMDLIQLNSINIQSKLEYINQTFNFIKPLELSAQNINWNNSVLANALNIQAVAQLSQGNLLPTIKDLKASLNHVSYQNAIFDSIEINCNLSNQPLIPGHIAAVYNNNWLFARGDFNLETKIAEGNFKGNASLNEITTLASQFIKQNILEDKIDGNIHWIGNIKAVINDTLKIENTEFIASSQDLSFNNINADKLYAEIHFNPELLNIKYLNANFGNNHAKGSIYHNFKTQAYRYLLAGSIKPEFLNPYLGVWWQELLDHFTFSTTTPFANFDIQGNLSTPDKWLVYGELLGKNFIYDSVPIHELILRINSSERILELMDLDLNSNTGKLQAYTKFEYGEIPNQNQIIYTFAKGDSSLALDELDKIIGLAEIHNIIKDFYSTTPPHISVTGSIYEKNPEQTKINILFTQNNPIFYYQIPFNRMDFTVDYTPKFININNINVEFAEGIGEGHLQIVSKNPGTPPELSADIHLIGVKQELAVNHLQKLWLPNQNIVKANNYGGLLTLDLNATGILGNWNSFIGSGNASITQANLGKINLFGILSQILSFTPLGLGSFNLTDATSDFYIQQNVIHFPNIHIFGSTGSIDAKGNFYLDNQELAFMIDISPVNKKGIPILSQVMLIFAPITQSFQMKLGGTLQNPKWETLLTPLGLGKVKGPELPQKIDVAK